jgi:hypothetical protein
MQMRSNVIFLLLFLASLAIAPLALGHGMSEADQARAATGGFMDFFPLGAMHMLTGYDHLLFLFGVVFFLTRFKEILKFVTVFTLGHSITLIFATFLGIQANYFLIDAVIALTVCYKGFDNLGGFKKHLNMKAPNLLAIVFIFGLIHGFGLSTRLQQVTIGSGMDLLGKIISFNLGVEAGQVAALTVILFALSMWRKTESFARFSTASNTALIIVGGLLCLMQFHGYSHEVAADSYPMNADAHIHAHEEMATTDPEPALPEGMHVDEPGGLPHGDHGHDHDAPKVREPDSPGEAAEDNGSGDDGVAEDHHVHGDGGEPHRH